jgi:predicted lipid-binding transport protein (Tim44 family)
VPVGAPAEPVEAPPAQAPVTEAPEASAKPKKDKPKKDKKGKGRETKGGSEDADGTGPSVAAHPRAARSVEHAKAWGALVGFLLGGYLSLPTHTLAGAGLRALIAGVVLFLAAWAGSLFFWRRMVMLEISSREQQLVAALDAAHAKRQAAAEAPGGTGR